MSDYICGKCPLWSVGGCNVTAIDESLNDDVGRQASQKACEAGERIMQAEEAIDEYRQQMEEAQLDRAEVKARVGELESGWKADNEMLREGWNKDLEAANVKVKELATKLSAVNKDSADLATLTTENADLKARVGEMTPVYEAAVVLVEHWKDEGLEVDLTDDDLKVDERLCAAVEASKEVPHG